MDGVRPNSSFDLLILGGGSAAFAAGEEAIKTSARVVLVEHGPMGGTCLNRGCVPSKFLIHRAALSDHRRTRWPQMRAAKDRFVLSGRASKQVFVRRHHARLTYLVGHGMFLSPHSLEVNGKEIFFKKGILAVGGRPSIPVLEGLSTISYLTSNTLFDLPTLPRSIIVLGAGPVGLEMAQMLSHFGVAVTLVSSTKRLLPNEEPELSSVIVEMLRRDGIRVWLGCSATHVVQNARGIGMVLVDAKKKSHRLRAQTLLVATGWAANTEGSGLEKTGVRLDDKNQIIVDRHLKTSAPHLWAAGDCVACHCPNRNVYVAKRQGAVAAAHALGQRSRSTIDYSIVPRVIFTSPEIAFVGRTEFQAKTKGRVISRTMPVSGVPRALLQDRTQGVVKLVADATTHRLLGASIIAPRAGELIHELAAALTGRLTLSDLREMFHAYPTYSEAIQMCAKRFL